MKNFSELTEEILEAKKVMSDSEFIRKHGGALSQKHFSRLFLAHTDARTQAKGDLKKAEKLLIARVEREPHKFGFKVLKEEAPK